LSNFAKTVKNHRTKLSALVALIFLILARPIPRSLLLGLPLIIIGVAIRIWSSGYLQKNRMLTVTGPYSLSRNPLYVGSFTLASGFVVAMADLRLAVVFLLFFGFVYWFTIRWEEKKLSRLFPDHWKEYSDRVPKVIPLFRIPEYKAGEFLWEQVFRNQEHANASVVLIVYLFLWGKAVFLGG